MTDESQQSRLEPKPVNQPLTTDFIAPQPKKSTKYLWIILGVVFSVLCLFSIICIVIVVLGAGKVAVEKAPVESVLDVYMKYMAAKDVDGAYALFSPRAQRQIPISKLQEMVEGNNYFLFEGYQSLSVENLNLSATINTNQDIPQGTVARVTGTITYEGDVQGTFNGTLEKVDDIWLIDGIFITVPPSKIKNPS